eukprot:COSAG01_NODE_2289_length_7984_cov_52.534432_1_plen_83_part_10
MGRPWQSAALKLEIQTPVAMLAAGQLLDRQRARVNHKVNNSLVGQAIFVTTDSVGASNTPSKGPIYWDRYKYGSELWIFDTTQ